jgi:hypothetical protein
MTRWTGAILLLCVAATACGYNPPEDGVAVTADPPATTTTTMLPPGGRQPTAEDPLRVLFAGDSVMADLAPAAIAALDAGTADARFMLAPGVALDATSRVLWQSQIESFDPEVVVVLVGTWETDGDLGPPGGDEWRARYDSEILDPFVELVTSEDADLVWVGMPAVAEAEATFLLADLNAAYAALPDRFDSVTYLPGGEFVSAPGGGFAEFLDGPNGPERVRRVDGLHLCPGGAIRIAEPVVGEILEQWNVAIDETWRTGSWTRPPEFPKPEECPA